MPDERPDTPPMREWSYEVMLGTIRTTVFAPTEDEADNLAMNALEGELYDALCNGTWYVQDEGEVDMDEAALGANHE